MSVSAVVLAFSSAAPASAAESAAPAGSSAVDQYKESIPTDDGTPAPTKRQRRALAESGRDGRQLAEVLAAGDGAGSGGPAAAAAPSGTGDEARSPGPEGSGSDAADAGPRGGSDSPGGGSDGDGRSGGAAGTQAEPGAEASERSPVKTTVSASLGAKVGPTQLWVALGVILVAGLGVAVVRRSA